MIKLIVIFVIALSFIKCTSQKSTEDIFYTHESSFKDLVNALIDTSALSKSIFPNMEEVQNNENLSNLFDKIPEIYFIDYLSDSLFVIHLNNDIEVFPNRKYGLIIYSREPLTIELLNEQTSGSQDLIKLDSNWYSAQRFLSLAD